MTTSQIPQPKSSSTEMDAPQNIAQEFAQVPRPTGDSGGPGPAAQQGGDPRSSAGGIPQQVAQRDGILPDELDRDPRSLQIHHAAPRAPGMKAPEPTASAATQSLLSLPAASQRPDASV